MPTFLDRRAELAQNRGVIEINLFTDQIGVGEDKNQYTLHFHQFVRRSNSSPVTAMRSSELGLDYNGICAVVDSFFREPEIGETHRVVD